MLDIFMDLADTSPTGIFYRNVAKSILESCESRVIPSFGYSHEDIAGYEHLIPTFENNEGAQHQIILGWNAVDLLKNRRILEFSILVETMATNRTPIRNNTCSRAQNLFSIFGDEDSIHGVDYCIDTRSIYESMISIEKKPVVYTLGSWKTAKIAVDFYVQSGHQFGDLLVVCFDCPINTKEKYYEMYGPRAPRPPAFITGRRAFLMDERLVHATGEVFFCHENELYRRLVAEAFNNCVCTDFTGDCPFSYLQNSDVEGDEVTIVSALDTECYYEQQLKPYLEKKDKEQYKINIEKPTEEEEIVQEREEIDRQVVVVMTVRDRPASYIKSSIDIAKTEIGKSLVAIILVYYDDDDRFFDDILLESLRQSITLVVCKKKRWNISHARNVGVKTFINMIQPVIEENLFSFNDCSFLFLNNDILLGSKWREDAISALANGDILVPRVFQGSGINDHVPVDLENELAIPGTGIIFVNAEILISLRGFDEATYTTPINEDLDFIQRARSEGVETQSSNSVSFLNQGPSWQSLSLAVIDIGDSERTVNPESWGEGGIVVVCDDQIVEGD